jgi:hypothetical protein
MSEVGMNGTAEPAHAPANGRVGAAVLWCIVAALACFVVAWPALHGLTATNDDIKFLRTTDRGLSAWGAIANAWKTSPAFRPMEILVAAGGDDVTLECPWVIPVHAAGLAVLAVAVVGLVRRAIPGSAAAAPLALLWILLSPATTVSAWQMDCGSQTWSAALGAWAMLLAWRAFDAAHFGPAAHVVIVHRLAPAEHPVADEEPRCHIDRNPDEGDLRKDQDQPVQLCRRHGAFARQRRLHHRPFRSGRVATPPAFFGAFADVRLRDAMPVRDLAHRADVRPIIALDRDPVGHQSASAMNRCRF